jgi:hypothetical protein
MRLIKVMANVIFSDIRKTISVSLPSYPESEVIMYESLLFGEVSQMNKSTGDDADKGLLSLQFLIKEWNFTNELGEKLPVSVEVLNSFSVEDITFLLKTVTDLFTKEAEEKKKSLKS